MSLGLFCWYLGIIVQLACLVGRVIALFWYTYSANVRGVGFNGYAASLSVMRAESRAVIVVLLALTLTVCTGSTVGGVVPFFSLSLWQCACLVLAWLATGLLLLIFERTRAGSALLSVEAVAVFVFTTVTAFGLFGATNMLLAFLVIELLGFIVLYAMLALSSTRVSNTRGLGGSTLVASLAYQFLMNFISSLLFYLALAYLVYYQGGLGYVHAELWGWSATTQSAAGCLVMAVFVKFGLGPWVFYKLRVYSGLGLLMFFLYTVLYFAIVLVFFFNLFTVFGLPLSYVVVTALLGMVSAAAIFFGAAVFQQGSVVLLLGLSSLLNLTLLSLQLGLLAH